MRLHKVCELAPFTVDDGTDCVAIATDDGSPIELDVAPDVHKLIGADMISELPVVRALRWHLAPAIRGVVFYEEGILPLDAVVSVWGLPQPDQLARELAGAYREPGAAVVRMIGSPDAPIRIALR